jgi:hypothetical protein
MLPFWCFFCQRYLSGRRFILKLQADGVAYKEEYNEAEGRPEGLSYIRGRKRKKKQRGKPLKHIMHNQNKKWYNS